MQVSLYSTLMRKTSQLQTQILLALVTILQMLHHTIHLTHLFSHKVLLILSSCHKPINQTTFQRNNISNSSFRALTNHIKLDSLSKLRLSTTIRLPLMPNSSTTIKDYTSKASPLTHNKITKILLSLSHSNPFKPL
jgi:hypothetical protein